MASASAAELNPPFPKSVIIILMHQVFERFSFWGIVVILPLYLRNALNFDDDSATSLYHGFTIFGYLSALAGAIAADSYFGKFRTIIGFSFVYFVGTFLLMVSAVPMVTNNFKLFLVLVGLILTALASGSVKPCIIAYGGDQFQLPKQQKNLDRFFPILYLIINFSLFLTAITLPMLRKDVTCFGEDHCYFLAFGVPFVLVLLAFATFVSGRKFYVNIPVEENVIFKAFGCIKTAILELCKSKGSGRKNWLDFADSKYDHKFIDDVRNVLRLLVLFLPVTVFWALFDQQFSRWTFQATRMNNSFFGYSIKPEQFATLNFVLTFLFIPIFEKIVYPILGKCNLLKKPLQRVIAGAFCASLSFVICAGLELKIESTLQQLPGTQELKFNLINGLPCTVDVVLHNVEMQNVSFSVAKYENLISSIRHSGNTTVHLYPRSITEMACENVQPSMYEKELSNGEGYSMLTYYDEKTESIEIVGLLNPDDLQKSLESNSKLRILYANQVPDNGYTSVHFIPQGGDVLEFSFEEIGGSTKFREIPPNRYTVKLYKQNSKDATDLGQIETFVGGNYVYTIVSEFAPENSSYAQYNANIYAVTDPNSVHMIWLLPQYAVMSIAEVMLEISLTGYAYSQAPVSMKSLLQVVNLIPPALGGILVVVIAEAKFFERQSIEFLLFAVINIIAVLILIFLAVRYKPVGTPAQKERTQPGEVNYGFEDN